MFRHRGEAQCQKVRGMLSEYIDNRLSNEEQSLVEHHIGKCDVCSRELASLRMTVQLLHRVPLVPAPRSFAIKAVEASRPSVFGSQSLRWLRPATALATIVLMLLLMGDFLHVFEHEVEVSGRAPSEPPGQTLLLPTPEAGGNVTAIGDDTLLKATPEPTPEAIEKAPTGKGEPEVPASPQVFEDEQAIAGEAVAGWPLRQIEIALAAVVLALVTAIILTRRQRKKAQGAKG